jgi:hypothetical protein
MYDHIQAAIHTSRIVLKTDVTNVCFEAQTVSQVAQFGEGKLRSLGIVDRATDEIEAHGEAGLLLE